MKTATSLNLHDFPIAYSLLITSDKNSAEITDLVYSASLHFSLFPYVVFMNIYTNTHSDRGTVH